MAETLLKKSQIIQSFENLPEEISADELIERILFIQLIERRLKSVEAGNTTPHEEFLKEIKSWRK